MASAQELIAESVDINDAEEKKPIKYGLAASFMGKFYFEDLEDVPNSEFYDSDDDEEDYIALRKNSPYNALEVAKRFLKQVRESYGYDLDCVPPPSLGSPFIPKRVDKLSEDFRNYAMGATHFAINKINVEEGRSYVFVKLEKVIDTICSLILLTFTVKEEVDSSQFKTIRAMVNVPYGTLNYELREWMYFTPPASTATVSNETMNVKEKKVKTGEVTSNLIRLNSTESALFEHILSYLDDKSAIKLASTCQSFRCVATSLKNCKPGV